MITYVTPYYSTIVDTTNHTSENYNNFNQNVTFIGEVKFTAPEIILMPR